MIDIALGGAMVLLVVLTVAYVIMWSHEKWKITSVHLRMAGLMILCFTVLAVMLFGMRLFLKPDVQLIYVDGTQVTYSNVTVAKDGTYQVELRELQTCDVTFDKTFPLFTYMGRVSRVNKYKMPCDMLTTDMKSDVATVMTYLKEDTRDSK